RICPAGHASRQDALDPSHARRADRWDLCTGPTGPRPGRRTTMSMESLTALLWRERQLLELLLFKLDVEQLLLTNGRNQWLAHATDEVTTVLEEIRTTELGHAVESDAVAARLGLAPGATLAQLAAAAPAPWDTILDEHRDAF